MKTETPRGDFRSGVIWVAGLNLFKDVLQFAQMLVLVRLLAPKAYGQLGFVTAINGFLTLVSCRCVSEYALLARPSETADYQTLFTGCGVIQVAIFAIANLTAVGMRFVSRYSEVALIMHVMSLAFLLDWPNEFRFKILEKAMNWKRLRLLQAASSILSTAAALALALGGFGVYALFLPSLLVPLPFIWDLFVDARWKPTWIFNWPYFREAGVYGLTRAGSGVIVFGRQLVESAILVQAVGYSEYGIFGRAIGLANLCCMKLPSFVIPLLFPVLSRFEIGTAEHKRANDLVLRSVTWTVVPVAILFSSLGSQVIQILYGNRWNAAIPLLPLAMAASAITAVSQTAGVLLVTSRQQRLCLASDAILLIGTTLCLLVFLKSGLSMYLLGIVLSEILSLALMTYWLVARSIIEAKTIWATFTVPLIAGTVAGVFCLTIKGTPLTGFPTLAYCIISGIIFGVLYFATLRAAGSTPLREILAYLPGGHFVRRALWLPA